VLEYHEGILFLTTNRAETIDPAFNSRIHLKIAYPTLTVESKSHLWCLFIKQGSSQQLPTWVDDSFLSKASGHDMNGRQIKNAVRVAHAVARDKDRDMSAEDIFSVLGLITSLEHENAAQSVRSTA
jgi:AAA+ superfamily predicted ATPase